METVSDSFKCYHFDNGHCKYKDNCHFRHFTTVCEIDNCPNKKCEARHPRKCSFYCQRGYCKFGTYCDFSHELIKVKVPTFETEKNEKDDVKIIDLNQKIDSQAKVLEIIKNSMESYQQQIENLKEEIENLTIIVDEKQKEIEDNTKFSEKLFECENCDKKYKTETGLNKHITAKHETYDDNYCGDSDLHASLSTANYQCEDCLMNFASITDFKHHDDTMKYSCEDCQLCFITKIQVEEHMELVHSTQPNLIGSSQNMHQQSTPYQFTFG